MVSGLRDMAIQATRDYQNATHLRSDISFLSPRKVIVEGGNGCVGVEPHSTDKEDKGKVSARSKEP
jgi:hypothetical protein